MGHPPYHGPWADSEREIVVDDITYLFVLECGPDAVGFFTAGAPGICHRPESGCRLDHALAGPDDRQLLGSAHAMNHLTANVALLSNRIPTTIDNSR